MFDLRKGKCVDLTDATCLRTDATYKFQDAQTSKNLVAKFIANYEDENDKFLIQEFKKLALLSNEPEIGSVYFLATANVNDNERSCYIMDFIDGPSLGQILKDNKNLSSDTIIDIITQIASGIEKAHNYEIFHSDLHEENILIDQFGFIKIIDFLWWDFKKSKEENIKNDLDKFKELVKKLIEKCNEDDKQNIEFTKKICLDAKSFKGLRKKIILMNEIAQDWCLLDEKGKKIISSLIPSIKDSYNLNWVIEEGKVDIPSKYIREINDREKILLETQKQSNLIPNLDQRKFDIYYTIEDAFLLKLHQLKQAGLVDWRISVFNIGELFLGPYKLTYSISLTPKLFKWKKINGEFNFVYPEEPLLDLILD